MRESEALQALGTACRAIGRNAQALGHHREALELAHALGQEVDVARAHHGIAVVSKDLGQLEHARLHWREAPGLLSTLGLDRIDETSAAEIRRRLAEIGQDA